MTDKQVRLESDAESKVQTSQIHELLLINDDYHTFDYVIEVLVEVCSHSEEQALQCAIITNYKGRCEIKRGSIEKLRSIRRMLNEKGLKTIIC